ncbi:unnamed protein product [marine sediment metagenome]|uniref:Uncharacterized protein n=1 Tax=marine sediment metagenome TaxID=412755 RepID=X0SBY1_9ZZZZ
MADEVTAARPGPGPSLLAEMQDYLGALKTVRFARRVFFILVFLSLLLQVALYLTIRFWDVQVLEQLLRDMGAAEPAAETGALTLWRFALEFGLPLAHFVGACATFLLAIAALLAVNVSLSGRLGGAQANISSFFWVVLLLAMLVPWQQIVPVTHVPSVFYSLGDLQHVAVFQPEIWLDSVLHYVRYVAYPLLGALVLLASVLGARRGYCQAADRMKRALGAPGN